MYPKTNAVSEKKLSSEVLKLLNIAEDTCMTISLNWEIFMTVSVKKTIKWTDEQTDRQTAKWMRRPKIYISINLPQR